MDLEQGKIYSGTVKNITDFGAFVDIYSKENSRDKATGMVHISEVSNEYVKNIHDFLKEGQKVKVFVLGKNENGKYSFSIKKTLTDNREEKTERKSEPKQNNFREKKQIESKPEPKDEFEAMMSRFKRISEDKMCDINRNRDRRNNSRRSK